MIRLFGHAPADPSATIRPVECELALEPMSIDEAFVVEQGGEKWVEHFESELVISRDDMRRILRRATLLSFREDAPVWTTVILMSKRHAPAKEIAELIEEERGGLTVSLRLRALKMWETPASMVLDGPPVIEAVPLVGGM